MRIDARVLQGISGRAADEARSLLERYERTLEVNPLLGYEPHPKQAQFHASTARRKCFFGGNRSGKTTAGLLDDLIQACDREVIPEHLLPYKKFEPPFYCRIVCPGEDLLFGVVFQKLREWVPRTQLLGDSWERAYQKSLGLLHFKNGSFFDFLTYGMDVSKFGGTAKHRIHYDEEPPEDIYNEGKVRLADYKGADTLFTMTPQKGMSWMFDAIWEPWQKGELRHGMVVQVSMDDNPYLAEEEKEIALEGYSKEELEARKEGRFVHFHGMIYGEFSRSRHVMPEVEVLPDQCRIYVGIDPGMRHMAAVVWCYLTPDDEMVVFDELALKGYTVSQVADAIRLRNQRWGQVQADGTVIPLKVDWSVIDPSARNIEHITGRSIQMEFADHQIVTILGQNSVTAGINRIKERLQNDRLHIAANCKTLIDQFRRYRWATPTRTENEPKEQPVKADDHLLDALRYVVMSRPFAPKPEIPPGFQTPLQKAMEEEIRGQRPKEIAKTPQGGVFA